MTRMLLALFVLSAPVVGFGAPIPVKESANAGPAAKLRLALDETGDVVFEGKTLTDVAAYFKSKLKAEVHFDQNALMALGIDPSAAMFTVKSRNAKIREGLKSVLASANLSYGIVGGNLYIGTEEMVIQQQMRQRVSLDGEPTSFSAVLKSLAGETGANLVLDPRIEEKAKNAAVKLKLDDVPLETAVRLTAEVAGFGAVRLSNVLFVTSEERAEKLKAIADPPTPLPQVFPNMHADILPPRAVAPQVGK